MGAILVAGCSGDHDDNTAASRHTSRSTTTEATTTEATTTTIPTATSAGTTSSSTAPPGTTAAPTTTQPSTPEGEVAADYLAYWQVYDRLAANPRADAGDIGKHASGQARNSLEQAVHDLGSQGYKTAFGPLEKHNPYAPSVIDDHTAYVADCHVSDSRVVDANGQEVRGDPAGGRPESIAATLVRGNGSWLVDSLQYYDLAPGETCTPTGPGP